MFALMHDQDRARSISGNPLGHVTGHQPRNTGIVMRRCQHLVRAQQRSKIDYMRANTSYNLGSLGDRTPTVAPITALSNQALPKYCVRTSEKIKFPSGC